MCRLLLRGTGTPGGRNRCYALWCALLLSAVCYLVFLHTHTRHNFPWGDPFSFLEPRSHARCFEDDAATCETAAESGRDSPLERAPGEEENWNEEGGLRLIEWLGRVYPLLDDCSGKPFSPQGYAPSQQRSDREPYYPATCSSAPAPASSLFPSPQYRFVPFDGSSATPLPSSPFFWLPSRLNSSSESLGSFPASFTSTRPPFSPAKFSLASSSQRQSGTVCQGRHYRVFFIQPLTYYYGMMDRWFSQMASSLFRESQKMRRNTDSRQARCARPQGRERKAVEHSSRKKTGDDTREKTEVAERKRRRREDRREVRGDADTERGKTISSARSRENSYSDADSEVAVPSPRGGHRKGNMAKGTQRRQKPASQQQTLREREVEGRVHTTTEKQTWTARSQEQAMPIEGISFDVFVWGEGFAGFPALRPPFSCPPGSSRPVGLLFSRVFPFCSTSSRPLSFGRAVSRWFGGQTENDVFLLHWTHLPRFADSRRLYSGYDASFWRRDVLRSSVFVLIEHEWVDDAQRRLLAVRPNLLLHTYSQVLAFGPGSKTFLGDAGGRIAHARGTGKTEGRLRSHAQTKPAKEPGSRHQDGSEGAREKMGQERQAEQLGTNASVKETGRGLTGDGRTQDTEIQVAAQTKKTPQCEEKWSVDLPAVYEKRSWASFLSNAMEWLFSFYRPPPTLDLRDVSDEVAKAHETSGRGKARQRGFWTCSAARAAAASTGLEACRPTEPSGCGQDVLLESLMPHGIDARCFLSKALCDRVNRRAPQQSHTPQGQPEGRLANKTTTATVRTFLPSSDYLTVTTEGAAKEGNRKRRDVWIASEKWQGKANLVEGELVRRPAWRGLLVPREREAEDDHLPKAKSQEEEEEELKWIDEEIERVVSRPRENDLLLVGSLACRVYPTRQIFSAALDSIGAAEKQDRTPVEKATSNNKGKKTIEREKEMASNADKRSLRELLGDNTGSEGKTESQVRTAARTRMIMKRSSRQSSGERVRVPLLQGNEPKERAEAAAALALPEVFGKNSGARFPVFQKTAKKEFSVSGPYSRKLHWHLVPSRPRNSGSHSKSGLRNTGRPDNQEHERPVSFRILPHARYTEARLEPVIREELRDNVGAIFDAMSRREETQEHGTHRGRAEGDILTRNTPQGATEPRPEEGRKHGILSHAGHLQGFSENWHQHHNSYLASMRDTKICLYGGHKGWTLRKGIEMLASGCLVVEMKLVKKSKKNRTKDQVTGLEAEQLDDSGRKAKDSKRRIELKDFQDFVVGITIDVSVIAAQDEQPCTKQDESRGRGATAGKQAPRSNAVPDCGETRREKQETSPSSTAYPAQGDSAAASPTGVAPLSAHLTACSSSSTELGVRKHADQGGAEAGDRSDGQDEEEDQEDVFVLEPETHWDAYLGLCALDGEARQRVVADVARQLRSLVRRFDDGQFDTLRREGMRFALLKRDYVYLAKTFLFPLIEAYRRGARGRVQPPPGAHPRSSASASIFGAGRPGEGWEKAAEEGFAKVSNQDLYKVLLKIHLEQHLLKPLLPFLTAGAWLGIPGTEALLRRLEYLRP